MRGLFDYDGRVMSIATRIANLMWLGVLTFLFSVPVVTAGASLTAMYYTVFQMREKDKDNVSGTFWHGFKSNFRQSTFLWLLMIVVACVFYIDFKILTEGEYTLSSIYNIILGVLAFVFVLTCILVFPLQARFENTWKNVLKNSLLMGLLHLPKAILVAFLHAVPFVISIFFPAVFPAVLVLGLSAPAYLNAAVLFSIYKTYAPPAETMEGDSVRTGEEDEEEIEI